MTNDLTTQTSASPLAMLSDPDKLKDYPIEVVRKAVRVAAPARSGHRSKGLCRRVQLGTEGHDAGYQAR